MLKNRLDSFGFMAVGELELELDRLRAPIDLLYLGNQRVFAWVLEGLREVYPLLEEVELVVGADHRGHHLQTVHFLLLLEVQELHLLRCEPEGIACDGPGLRDVPSQLLLVGGLHAETQVDQGVMDFALQLHRGHRFQREGDEAPAPLLHRHCTQALQLLLHDDLVEGVIHCFVFVSHRLHLAPHKAIVPEGFKADLPMGDRQHLHPIPLMVGEFLSLLILVEDVVNVQVQFELIDFGLVAEADGMVAEVHELAPLVDGPDNFPLVAMLDHESKLVGEDFVVLVVGQPHYLLVGLDPQQPVKAEGDHHGLLVVLGHCVGFLREVDDEFGVTVDEEPPHEGSRLQFLHQVPPWLEFEFFDFELLVGGESEDAVTVEGFPEL